MIIFYYLSNLSYGYIEWVTTFECLKIENALKNHYSYPSKKLKLIIARSFELSLNKIIHVFSFLIYDIKRTVSVRLTSSEIRHLEMNV